MAKDVRSPEGSQTDNLSEQEMDDVVGGYKIIDPGVRMQERELERLRRQGVVGGPD